MRVLWFVVALLLVSSAEASDDRPLSDKKIAEVKACMDKAKGRLTLIAGSDKRAKKLRWGYNKELKSMQENLNGTYNVWIGCEITLEWLDEDFLIATGQKEAPPLTDYERKLQEAQEYMDYLETARKKLAAQAERHVVDAQHNGFRLDYFYMADGTLDWCRTQVYSQGPIMKCSRWPE